LADLACKHFGRDLRKGGCGAGRNEPNLLDKEGEQGWTSVVTLQAGKGGGEADDPKPGKEGKGEGAQKCI